MTRPNIEIDFYNIKALDGLQHAGFEELCCQIFRNDKDGLLKDLPKGSEPIRYRGAGGDGGVEFIWKLPNGDEWGLQAKYLFSLDKKQLDKSVKTALEIHPNLTRYIFCLPYDLTGKTGRGEGEREKYEKYK